MKTVGIIGGLGPETTAKFYLKIITSLKDKKQRPPLLIWNVPIPLEVEKELIIEDRGEEKFLPLLIDAAKNLEKGGADFLVMPCNTMHIFIEEIRKSVDIPVINILEEVAEFINKQKLEKISVLGTSKTVKRKLFQAVLSKHKIECKVPNQKDQSKLNKIIINILMNSQSLKDKRSLIQIIGKITDKDTKTVLLACTDLQLIASRVKGIRIIDTMEILVDATVRHIQNGSNIAITEKNI